jgi:hypothetical protein
MGHLSPGGAMTIRRGEPWGEPAVCPTDLRVVATDRDLREWVVWHRTRDQPIRALGVAGGDLARTCGGGATAHPTAAKVTVDAMRVTLDDSDATWGVAHVVARRWWLRGEVVMAMNAQFLGRYDVAPRSHPNDGKLDIVRVDPMMGPRQRLQARQRALTGTHVPHRQISARSAPSVDFDFAEPMVIWIDGVRSGTARHLSVIVEPDAFVAYV